MCGCVWGAFQVVGKRCWVLVQVCWGWPLWNEGGGGCCLLPCSILSVRGVGDWELQKCLWGLSSGITCPETEAVKSLCLFQAVHAGCSSLPCCVLCSCAGAQWEVGMHGCSSHCWGKQQPPACSLSLLPQPQTSPGCCLQEPLGSLGCAFWLLGQETSVFECGV